MRIVVMNSVTLDGVMQGPGRVDEDTRDGFGLGGWAARTSDEVMRQAMGEHWARLSGLLFGRRTYEEVLGYWNRVAGNPFATPLNEARKYVVSSTLREPLPWPNSTLLAGDAIEAVARLKAEPGGELGIMGSGVLIGALLPHNLVDEFLLMIHPVVLGSGRRLFPDGVPPTELTLVDARTSPTGVLIATYRTDRPTA